MSASGTRSLLADGGITGELIRSTDWARTPVGPIESWPSSLRTIVEILLHSRHPMFLWWGPELIQFYNDAYLPSFGDGKHPAAMGARGPATWPEIWPIIGPQIDAVMSRGEATWQEDALVPIFRNGKIEDVYWTYGYSPVFDDVGAIAGVLVDELEGLRVLVVDDDVAAREGVSSILSEHGAILIAAQSAVEAVDALVQYRPDVVISDIAMPGEDGYSFIRRVRRLPPEDGAGTPAAALTSYTSAEDRTLALVAGYQMHIPKPARRAELVTAVASLARIARSMR